MSEDQVAVEREGGVRGCKRGKRPPPEPKCSDYNPRRPDSACLTTAGDQDNTYSRLTLK